MAVVATGFFDGVHPGHRLVIDTLLSEARSRGEQSVVVTFWPHPRAVLQSDADSLRYLSTRTGKDTLLRAMGVDRVETVPFSRHFASLSAAEYLDMLRNDFGCTKLVLGYDTRFGCEQAGPQEIAELAARSGMEAVITPPVCIDGAPVSSSRIRSSLEAGDVVEAAKLLGRPYRLYGVVVSGNRLGRTIGFPTANMKLYDPLMLIPCKGVYRSRVQVLGRWLDGLTNVGVRPTVGDSTDITVETYILDFDEMIYGLDITVDFLGRLRDEHKFASLEALRAQLLADVALIKNK